MVTTTGQAGTRPAHRDTIDRHEVRARTLAELRGLLSADELEGVDRCATRLSAELPHPHELERNVVLVGYGGGKDSSYMLAYVRAVQLHLFDRHGSTFSMRVATNRHAGMPQAVMDNVDRCYRALRLYDDPGCELLLIDGAEVRPFAVDAPLPPAVVERNRQDILMTGHRTGADARPTFCNACNLSMVNSFGLAAGYGGGVDVIVTGDSLAEQRAYRLWVNRLARQLRREQAAVPEQRPGFGGFLASTDTIAQAYFRDLYGPDADELVAERRITAEVGGGLRFFSVYGDTAYDAGSHWHLLTDYLGFRFDELAFSFTESDCGNPGLMAHLRGLKCEHVFGRGYAEGVAEYVEFAVRLMRTKEFPERLVGIVRERYDGPGAVTRMRTLLDGYAHDAFGLTEEQLVCATWAPFIGKGDALERYLAAERPDLADAAGAIRALLDGTGEPDSSAAGLAAELERLSGLELRHLRVLYLSPPYHAAGNAAGDGLIGAILAGDPHKSVIETRHAPDGPVVHELLSGR